MKRIDFMTGFAAFAIEMIRLHGHDEIVRDVVTECGYVLDDFKHLGLESDDLATLSKAMKQ